MLLQYIVVSLIVHNRLIIGYNKVSIYTNNRLIIDYNSGIPNNLTNLVDHKLGLWKHFSITCRLAITKNKVYRLAMTTATYSKGAV